MKYKCTDCDYICSIPNTETKAWTLPKKARDHLFYEEHHGFIPLE